ncbi:MAG: NAD(P)/FAD-dependent oxidoreductase [Candidatus Paceibacterota bacterium]
MDTYDVVIIGGGAAGLFAGAVAGARGKKVLILEKNEVVGKKLRITGGGRCNICNAQFDRRALASEYGAHAPFLHTPFSIFDAQSTFDYFQTRGLELKTEDNNRAFPVTDSAESVCKLLIDECKRYDVKIRTHAKVVGLKTVGSSVEQIVLENGIVHGKKIILSTGGMSHPETGSTGDGFTWLTNLKHTVTRSVPTLVPIRIREQWVKDAQGITLPHARITIRQNEKSVATKVGKLLFTHFGVSGPAVINLSPAVADALQSGPVALELDLYPALTREALDLKLQDLFKLHMNKRIKNGLTDLIPTQLAEAMISLACIDPLKEIHQISREERLQLVATLKGARMTVDKLLGTDKAIITSGGVDLREVDMKTMRSKLYSNLFLIGDILDIERPSGGFSLQLCWTTGYIAGINV